MLCFCFFFIITQYGLGQVNRTGERLQIPDSPILVKELSVGNEVSSVSPVPKKGDLNVFVFWMASCGPCIRELDMINLMLDTLSFSDNVKIYAISTDSPDYYQEAFEVVSDHQWSFHSYHDSKTIFKRMFLGNWFGTPQSFIVDSEGVIKYHNFGYRQGDVEELIAQLNILLNE